MKIIHLLFAGMILFAHQALGNNIQISNVRLTSQNTTDDFSMVEFDISWENSWRYSGGPANWDAAWVFVKYRLGAGPWLHAWLNNTGHTSPSNATITNGFLSPDLPFHATTNPSLGVFLYRSVPGSGTFTCQDVQLRWNYGTNSLGDNVHVDIRVFAVEMIYIPEGSFLVGSGGTELGAFYEYPNTNTPFNIISEAAITVGTTAGNLYYPASLGSSGDQLGPIPATFPKGYKAFYCMKYEISQQGYVDFLNTLTRTQQIERVASDISGTSVTNQWVMSNTPNIYFRSYIRCRTTIPAQPGLVDFLVDQNANNIGGEISDGQNVACGFLGYNDLAAYLDWTALRLMSDFEFEKCGRGKLVPVPGEYAWGNNTYNAHTGVLNIGMATETPIDEIVNAASDINAGPLRVGIFARNNSIRTISGAGYYGCLELSSNLFERGTSIGSPAGRSYIGNHGNGVLSPSGNHDVTTWPDILNPIGNCFRGGSFIGSTNDARLSDRRAASLNDSTGYYDVGGRGVRTAQ